MDLTTRHLDETAALRALAHPLRQRLYEQVILFGPLTATELAERVDDSPSNCSWHLRKLAEHGFIEQVEGSGRQRPWRGVVVSMSWDDKGGDDKGRDEERRRAGQALTRMFLEREQVRRDQALARLPLEPPEWRDAAAVNQSLLWLTTEELAEINTRIQELLVTGVERHGDPSLRPDGARLCSVVAWGLPTPDLNEAP